MIPLDSALVVAVEAVELGSNIVRSQPGSSVSFKGDRDMVTEVDLEVERTLRDFLGGRFPEVGLLAEEGGVTGRGSRLRWVLDPVDGTANYTHGIPLCAVSLALVSDGTPVVGAVALPFLARTYSAARGHGARVNGESIRASATTRLVDAAVAIGDYAVGPDAAGKNAGRFALTELLAPRVQRIRMLGSAAIDLVWVAEGRLDACLAMSNKPWDVSAGVIIAREAGARVIDLTGRSHAATSSSTVASAPGITGELVELLAGRERR